MSNPLFDMLGGSALPPIVQQFMQFKQSFKGDPKQQVQQMLNSGKITKDQYNAAVKKAQDLQKILYYK